VRADTRVTSLRTVSVRARDERDARVQLGNELEQIGHELFESLKERVDVLVELHDERLDQGHLLAAELLQREHDALRERVAMSKSQARKDEARTYTNDLEDEVRDLLLLRRADAGPVQADSMPRSP
jgi:RNA binding exosome subunit